jgi:hypothetical protein
MAVFAGPTTRVKRRDIAYWTATGLVGAELLGGGAVDVLRTPAMRDVVVHLGYPTYLLVMLGVWKLLGAAALLAPRLPVIKEWAYAGAFFVYSGAVVSHLVTRSDLPEIGILAVLIALTFTSWVLRPVSRRLGVRA